MQVREALLLKFRFSHLRNEVKLATWSSSEIGDWERDKPLRAVPWDNTAWVTSFQLQPNNWHYLEKMSTPPSFSHDHGSYLGTVSTSLRNEVKLRGEYWNSINISPPEWGKTIVWVSIVVAIPTQPKIAWNYKPAMALNYVKFCGLIISYKPVLPITPMFHFAIGNRSSVEL